MTTERDKQGVSPKEVLSASGKALEIVQNRITYCEETCGKEWLEKANMAWRDYNTSLSYKELLITRVALTTPSMEDELAEALEKISRMITLLDHKANTFTLVTAKNIAYNLIAKYRERKK